MDQWKIILDDKAVFCIQNRFNIVRTPCIGRLQKDKKGSRLFYDIFATVNYINKDTKGENKLGHINERDWKISYLAVTDIDEI